MSFQGFHHCSHVSAKVPPGNFRGPPSPMPRFPDDGVPSRRSSVGSPDGCGHTHSAQGFIWKNEGGGEKEIRDIFGSVVTLKG